MTCKKRTTLQYRNGTTFFVVVICSQLCAFLSDVNECGTQLVLCDVNAECVNLFGTYSCHCRPGFKDESRLGSGGTTCMEVQPEGMVPLADYSLIKSFETTTGVFMLAICIGSRINHSFINHGWHQGYSGYHRGLGSKVFLHAGIFSAIKISFNLELEEEVDLLCEKLEGCPRKLNIYKHHLLIIIQQRNLVDTCTELFQEWVHKNN